MILRLLLCISEREARSHVSENPVKLEPVYEKYDTRHESVSHTPMSKVNFMRLAGMARYRNIWANRTQYSLSHVFDSKQKWVHSHDHFIGALLSDRRPT
jgi:hypothetical protein